MGKNHDIQESIKLPFSVKSMFGTMIVAGILLLGHDILRDIKGLYHPLEFEAVTRSPIAGRIGMLILPAVLYWIPGYFLYKRRRIALYFCILISMFFFLTFIYSSFKTGGIRFIYREISDPFWFGHRLISSILFPGFAFYLLIRWRHIFHWRFKKQLVK